MCYYAQKKSINIWKMHYICFFAVLGDFVNVLTVHADDTQMTLNLIAIAIFVIIPIVQNNLALSIVCSLFATVVAFRSAYRISILVVLVAILFSLIYAAIIRRKLKSLLLMIVAIVALFCLIQNFDSLVKTFSELFDMNYASYRRISTRLISAVHGNDIHRYEIYEERISLCFTEIIPFGLFRRAVGEYGWYTDTPFVFMLDAYGVLGGVALVFISIKKGIGIFVKALRSPTKPFLGVLAVLFPVMLVLFVLNGTFLFWSYVVCMTSAILGYWFNSNVDNLS